MRHSKHSRGTLWPIEMNTEFDTPWAFFTKSLSPNNKIELEYSSINEIGMGGPLADVCSLKIEDNRYQLSGLYGGPVVWTSQSDKIALPFWTKNRKQKLAIIDISEMKIYLSKEEFRVLNLKSFESKRISGTDSPIHRPVKVDFILINEQFSDELEIK